MVLREYGEMEKIKNTTEKQNLLLELNISLVVSTHDISLVLVQHANDCDTNENGSSHLCYMSVEGILPIFLIISFSSLPVLLWGRILTAM